MTYPGSPVYTVEAVRRHGWVKFSELSAELGTSPIAQRANAGGLHDYGYVTVIGDGVRWDGPDDEYVLACVAAVHAPPDACLKEDS